MEKSKPACWDQLNLSENLKPIAMQAYKSYRGGTPVVIMDKDENILHGVETLEMALYTRTKLNVLQIKGIDREEFKAGDLPAFCEAERRTWLEGKFPGEYLGDVKITHDELRASLTNIQSPAFVSSLAAGQIPEGTYLLIADFDHEGDGHFIGMRLIPRTG